MWPARSRLELIPFSHYLECQVTTISCKLFIFVSFQFSLSTLKYWHENTHPMHQIVRDFFVAFDEYPVENFHSVLRSRTKETDTVEQVREKSKESDVCKKEMQAFQSSFVPPKKFTFSRKRIDNLKARAAEFLVSKFEAIHSHPGRASQPPRQPRQKKNPPHHMALTEFV